MLKLSDILGAKQNTGTPAAADKEVGKKYPALHLMLTATQDDEGKLRQTCTMTIVCESGLWKAGLRERDRSMSLWRSSKTLEGVYGALEEALTGGEADWRESDSKSRK